MRFWLTAGCACVALAAVPSFAIAVPAAARVYDSGSDAFCTQPGSTRSAAKRPGPFSWLMRVARDDVDDEPGRLGAVMSYYLRSPLLTSFFNIVPCPNPEKRLDDEQDAEHCALLVVRGREGEEVVKVELPAAGATTAVRLRAMISEHQARGEPFLIIQPHGELELAAGAIREVRAGGC